MSEDDWGTLRIAVGLLVVGLVTGFLGGLTLGAMTWHVGCAEVCVPGTCIETCPATVTVRRKELPR